MHVTPLTSLLLPVINTSFAWSKVDKQKPRLDINRKSLYVVTKCWENNMSTSFMYSIYMRSTQQTYTTIDAYLASCPVFVRATLQELRDLIHTEIPGVQEKISYGIPTFYLRENLVHFAAYTHHIGFYPTSAPIEFFKNELRPYRTSKGAVQFPLDATLPFDLIRKMIRFRIQEYEKKIRNKS